MRAPRIFLLFLGLVLATSYLLERKTNLSRAQTQQSGATPCCGQPDETAPREIDFPYYSLRDGFNSTLLLVNDSPKPLDLVLAVHSASGQTVLVPTMTIQPQQKLPIDLRNLLTQLAADTAGDFGEGSLAIQLKTSTMPLGASLTVSDPAGRMVLQPNMVNKSPGLTHLPRELHGLWWGIGGPRDARIMVSNTSAKAVLADVHLDFLGEQHASAPLSFQPHETKVLSISALLAGSGLSPAGATNGGISIVPRGGEPALIAQGTIGDPMTGFSAAINFPPAQLPQASALHASGVPIGTPTPDSPFAGLGTFFPHVIVRNLSPTPQTVAITVEYPGEAGTEETILPPWQIAAYSTHVIPLEPVFSELPLPLPFCSIRIQHSGPPGSAIAEVASVEIGGDMVISSHVVSEDDPWAGSGSYLWQLGEGRESVLFLTNIGDREVAIGFRVQAEGVAFFLTNFRLEPHETRAINLRELRDQQEADFLGNVIPAQATQGSVAWIRADLVPVMGALLMLDGRSSAADVSPSYSCNCPCSFTGTVRVINPNATTTRYMVYVGESKNFGAQAYMTDCGVSYFWLNVTSDSRTNWSSQWSGIASVNNSTSKGRVTGNAPGETTIKAVHTGKDFLSSLFCSPKDKTGTGTINVQVNNKCYDVRDQITEEYRTYDVGWFPVCSYYTQTAHSYYFSFGEFNTGNYSWALVKRPLVIAASSGYGLDRWRELYGGPRIINSAYRNPVRNASVGGKRDSRHQHGDAVDLRNQTGTAAEWDSMYRTAGDAGADYREPVSDSGLGHVHADWRYHNPEDYAQ